MKYKNLLIIGTSHVAQQSLDEITLAFQQHKPDIVAVELDRKRLHALLSDEHAAPNLSAIRKVGLKGYLFAVIGGFLQRKLGNVVGVKPGSEMKLAVELAKKIDAKIALIDQDIEVTLKKFSLSITWREKFRFVIDVFNSLLFRKKTLAELGIGPDVLDLSKVPEKELVKKLMLQLKGRYPNVYSVLVKERNRIMANNIAKLIDKFPDENVLVVIGAGHEDDVFEMVKKSMQGKVDIV
ncbi:MAG: TraB/GumN family protein [Candidatus Woesearchaeota archaeon]